MKVSMTNSLNRNNAIMANVPREEMVVAVVPTKQKTYSNSSCTVYKKRGPKPKYIKEAEAAHATAVAAQKKQLASPKKKGKRKHTDIDGGAHNAAIESSGKERKRRARSEAWAGTSTKVPRHEPQRNTVGKVWMVVRRKI